jgi:hypothetical protein
MNNTEAKKLAEQLNLTVKDVWDFSDQIDALGLTIGIERHTGDWIVLNSSEEVLARLA